MELAALAAKQKRLRYWAECVQHPSTAEETRVQTLDTLKLYRNRLAKCWEANLVAPEDEAQILDLERRLEELNLESRLGVTVAEPAD